MRTSRSNKKLDSHLHGNDRLKPQTFFQEEGASMKRARTVKIILSILALFVAAGSQAAVAEISSTPGWYVEGTQPNEKFCMINAAGDVNRDGYADVLVGAPSNGLGYVSLFCGSPSGLSTKPSWTVVNNQDGAWFGFNCVGDFNGDGYLDVAIGAPYYNNGKSNAGRVYIYYGSASGLSTTANLIIEGNQAGAFFGWFFQEHFVGDLNKDGYDDIIIPSWGYNNSAGQISVYYGSATGLSDVPGWTVSGDQAGGTFGKACIAGDINGDGYLDVIVGAEGYNNGLSGA
ncbi:MAG: FG-GAP-like repeat-containing protein, partial [Candidatus Portnoybacteria bacterium]|nr:FG-GAP-like repeat-containing protein [Candidatus Portnoybacteria bacterium]